MSIIVFGINHHTASITQREKFVFTPDSLPVALNALHAFNNIESVVILSTCNRSEVYCELAAGGMGNLTRWLSNFYHVDMQDYQQNTYYYQDMDAVEHLMRVASGLDSQVIGEPQILGQVKQAYQYAKQEHCIHGILEKLFQQSFHVAKQVRSQTAIGKHPVSIAFASCLLARDLFNALENLNVLLIGAGETISLIAQHLCHPHHQPKHLLIANRTQPKAQVLADQYSGKTLALEQIPDSLSQIDIIISSTSSPDLLVHYDDMQKARTQKTAQPLLVIDLAVPRDIDPQIAQLPNVHLYSIDDLQSIIEKNQEQRKLAAIQAQDIVLQHAQEFMKWRYSLQAVDSIKTYRNKASAYKEEQVDRSLHALELGEDPKIVIQNLANKLTKKLIHAPTHALQEAGKEQNTEQLEIISKILGL